MSPISSWCPFLARSDAITNLNQQLPKSVALNNGNKTKVKDYFLKVAYNATETMDYKMLCLFSMWYWALDTLRYYNLARSDKSTNWNNKRSYPNEWPRMTDIGHIELFSSINDVMYTSYEKDHFLSV